MVRTKHSQRGFTLIELMISLVLFSILIAGVLSVAVTMAQGYREQRQVVATDTSVRAPMDYLGDLIRQASPGVPSGTIFTTVGQASCPAVGVLPPAVSMVDSASAPDSLDIVFAYGGLVTSTRGIYSGGATLALTDTTNIKTGDMLLITNVSTDRGHIVFVTGVTVGTPGSVNLLAAPACNAATMPAGNYPVNSLAIRVMKARISLATDGQAGISNPDLVLNPYDPTAVTSGGFPAANAQPIAENIEDIQFALGTDTNADNIITTAAPNEWANSLGVGALVGPVRAVRITMTSKAPQDLVGGTGFLRPAAENRPIATVSDGSRRRTLTSTVEVRNMKGSL